MSMGRIYLMTVPNPNKHSIIARVCHMAIGTLITLQHVIVLLHQAIPDMKTPIGDQTSTHRVTMIALIQILAILINTVCGRLMITQTIAITLNGIMTVSSINIITKDRTMPSLQLMPQSKKIK